MLKKSFVLFFVLLFLGCSDEKIILPPTEVPYPDLTLIFPLDEEYFLFSLAEKVTGTPADILYGIACTESDLTPWAVGDDGKSLGMMQLNNDYREMRESLYGAFDPFDPLDAVIIAGRIMQENYVAYPDKKRMAIASYRQGVYGVKINGIQPYNGYCYVDKVLAWASEYDASFFYEVREDE